MKDTLAIIFAFKKSEQMKSMTQMRSLPSVPFGGRYRLIDFALSNIVNSGITKVGIVTRTNYQSLMDHLGTGKEWDLNRKKDGLFVLPPFLTEKSNGGLYRGAMEALLNAESFIRMSNHEHVLLTDADAVCNMTYEEALEFHKKKKADITIIYKRGNYPQEAGEEDESCFIRTDENDRVVDVSINPVVGREKRSMDMVIIDKSLLSTLIWECHNRSAYSFYLDVVAHRLKDLNIYGFEYTGAYYPINSIVSYYKTNMMLLDEEARREIFNKPVYTKVHDDVPNLVLEGASVKNSLISDGCIIQGTVENSILSRGVKVRPGAVVRNSIIMQGCEIQAGSRLEYVISDKNVVVRENTKVISHPLYPMVIEKGSVV